MLYRSRHLLTTGSSFPQIVQSKGNLATKQTDVLNNAIQSGIHWGPEGLPDYDRYWLTNAVYRLRRKFFNQQYCASFPFLPYFSPETRR